MTRKTIGRAALIIATGLLLVTGAPSRAAETADGDAAVEMADAAKPLVLTKAKKSRTRKASRAHKAKQVALKNIKNAAEAKQAKAAAENDKGAAAAALPDSVANANARIPSPDARGKAAMSGNAPLDTAAANQLEELDRSLAASPSDEPRRITTQLVLNDQPQSALPVVTPEPSVRPTAQVSTVSSGDAWAHSSLIGKIFIAFGGMLTLASAARMLIA